MKLELHNKESFAEVNEDIKMKQMVASIKIARTESSMDAVIYVLDHVLTKLVVDGKDVTDKKMEVFDNMGSQDGGMILMSYADGLFKKAAAVSKEDKKK